ncbi:MAG: Mur ligase family protein [Thermoguttaceae bacterium]
MQVCPDLGHLVSLREVLPEADIQGADDVAISGCACDSRRVHDGELFAAFAERRDGRESIATAVARGCAAVLMEDGAGTTWREEASAVVPVCVVPNVRESYARLCQTLAGRPSRRLKTIGVAGSSGRTATSCLIAGVLHAADYRAGILGELGYLDGRNIERGPWTTPPPDRLAPLLARMVRNECSHAVMELSDSALEQSRVAGVEFDAVCAARMPRRQRPGHKQLFGQLGPEGFAVLNADDVGSAEYVRRLACPVLTVGIRSPAEITATPLEQCMSEQTFLLTAGSQSVPVRTPMIGRQHIANCLVAAAVGLGLGIELTTVVRGLEYAGQVPGQLERIECGQPFGVFVDRARTPRGLARVLKTLQDVTVGRVISVSEGTGDRKAAIHRALGAARPGDCVLIAGSQTRRQGPDDREIARNWLYRGRWITN